MLEMGTAERGYQLPGEHVYNMLPLPFMLPLGSLLSASWDLWAASWEPPQSKHNCASIFWPMGSLLVASWGILATSWEPLECLLGSLGCILGAPPIKAQLCFDFLGLWVAS